MITAINLPSAINNVHDKILKYYKLCACVLETNEILLDLF